MENPVARIREVLIFNYQRGRCCFCQKPDSDISVIVEPSAATTKKFHPFNEHAHEACMFDWERSRVLPPTTVPRILQLEQR